MPRRCYRGDLRHIVTRASAPIRPFSRSSYTWGASLTSKRCRLRAITKMPRGSIRLLDLLAPLIFLSFGLAVVLRPYVMMREMPGDLGDAAFSLSLLEFFYRTLLAALRGRLANFVDAPFYYPWPRVANFSETYWGDAGIYALFRAFGMDLLTAFQ